MRVAEMIGSFGGPRVLIPVSRGEQWQGATEQWMDPDGEHNDHYAMACESGYLSSIEPFGAPVVVFGCEPGDLRHAELSGGHVYWVWVFGESEEQLRRLALGTFELDRWDESLSVPLEGRYRSIDAAVSWSDATECLEAYFDKGAWSVGCTYVEHDDTAAVVYGFRRTSTSI